MNSRSCRASNLPQSDDPFGQGEPGLAMAAPNARKSHPPAGLAVIKLAGELALAKLEISYLRKEKEKRTDELHAMQNKLILKNKDKRLRASELVIANKELIFQNHEKEQRAAELVIANEELKFQNEEKEKRAAELYISNTYLENLINHANAPIVVWDPDFRITRCNRAFETLTGLTAAEAAGQTMEVLFPPAAASDSMGRIRRTLNAEQLETEEIEILHRDGSTHSVIWNSATLFDPDGQVPFATIAQGQDITRRKRAEAEQIRLTGRLNQTQALESLGVLVAGVAHNINNVLTIIMGTAALREQLGPAPPDMAAYGVIGKACMRGRDVVKALIQFGQPTLASQSPFELHGLIQEVRFLLESTTRNLIAIKPVFFGDPLWVNGDASSINHALVNLCLNAMDAMPDGGTVTIRTASPDPVWADVSVEDHGCGMVPEVLAHAVEPFFTTKEVGKGTGLGLSMTYGVVKAHGGGLELSSRPGLGTIVKFRLPRIPAPAHAADAAAPALPIHPMEVLLVDDDQDVRTLMTRMITKAGEHKVTAVDGGEAALERIRSGIVPDLVILDQNMPGMTGTQAMAQIRDLCPDLPILISSGQPNIEDWDCCKRPKVGVISKPFGLEEIRAKLAQFAIGPEPEG